MIDPKEKLRSVELSPYDDNWPQAFEKEASTIKPILGGNALHIDHIGSTAIPGIYAKPIIDILVTVKSLETVDTLNAKFESLGYSCMGEYGIPGRRYYWKSRAKRTHHIHLFNEGSPEITEHLAFRNFMRTHSDYAQAYSTLKRTLAGFFPHDIERYLDGKAPFIKAAMNGKKSHPPVDIPLELPEGSKEQHWVALLERLGYARSTAADKTCWHFPEKESLYSLTISQKKR